MATRYNRFSNYVVLIPRPLISIRTADMEIGLSRVTFRKYCCRRWLRNSVLRNSRNFDKALNPSQVLDEELDARLECAFLARFNFRVALNQGVNLSNLLQICKCNTTHQVTTDRKAVYTACPVSPFITRSELTAAKNFVSDRLSLLGKLRVDLARVDQQGCFRLRFIFLSAIIRSEYSTRFQ